MQKFPRVAVRGSVLMLAALVLATAGCRRPRSSPQFDEAFSLYNQLYSRSLDDAYGDPQMERVAELLQQVDPRSTQSAEAKELLAKVNDGIAEYRARAARVAADQARAEAPAEFKGGGAILPVPTSLPRPPAVAGPALGMTRDDFLARFADCFDRRGDYEQGTKRGEAFAVLPTCAQRYPTFVDSLVVLMDNKVTSLVAIKDVAVQTIDAGEAAPPPSAQPPPPPVVPPPAPVRYYPGAPRPELGGESPPTPAP